MNAHPLASGCTEDPQGAIAGLSNATANVAFQKFWKAAC